MMLKSVGLAAAAAALMLSSPLSFAETKEQFRTRCVVPHTDAATMANCVKDLAEHQTAGYADHEKNHTTIEMFEIVWHGSNTASVANSACADHIASMNQTGWSAEVVDGVGHTCNNVTFAHSQ